MKTKNTLKALAFAMLMPAMLLTTACSNDDDAINNGDNKKGYPLQVTVNVTRQGDKATTRATYNESTKTLAFSAGDQLLVRGNDNSEGGAGSFAGMLDYVSEGTFSGTIYTQNSYSGTADALFTAATANWVGAALFPNGYDTYEFLSLSGSGYSTSYSMSYNKAIAATKAAAVEQFSLETAKTYSSGFALSPENAILNFTITGLTDGAKDVVLKNGESNMFSGSVTPTSGTAVFALGARIKDYSDWPVNLKNVILTIGGTDIDITDANNNLTAGKIYNITRSAAPALTYPIALGDATSDYVGSVVTTDGNVYATVAAASAASKTAVAVIAYVGALSDCTHGLAISLSDILPYQMNYTQATGEYGIPAWAAAHPIAGATWRLPSEKDWQYMLWGDHFDDPNVTNISTSAISTVLENDSYYWTSTEVGTDNAKTVYYKDTYAGIQNLAKTEYFHVRACLVF